jgi:hypothetical protein
LPGGRSEALSRTIERWNELASRAMEKPPAEASAPEVSYPQLVDHVSPAQPVAAECLAFVVDDLNCDCQEPPR